MELSKEFLENYKYHVEWSTEPKEQSSYNYWNSSLKYEIGIVQYHNKMERFVVEYTDNISLPSNRPRGAFISISCHNLHDAKLFGDKVAKEYDEYRERTKNDSIFNI